MATELYMLSLPKGKRGDERKKKDKNRLAGFIPIGSNPGRCFRIVRLKDQISTRK
jgi:hypothetical protein